MSDPDEYFAEVDRRMNLSDEDLEEFIARRTAERHMPADAHNSWHVHSVGDQEPQKSARQHQMEPVHAVPLASAIPAPFNAHEPSNSSPGILKRKDAHHPEPDNTFKKKAKYDEYVEISNSDVQPDTTVKRKRDITADQKASPAFGTVASHARPTKHTEVNIKKFSANIAAAAEGTRSNESAVPVDSSPIQDATQSSEDSDRSTARNVLAGTSATVDDSLSHLIPQAAPATQLRAAASMSKSSNHSIARRRGDVLVKATTRPRPKHADSSSVTTPGRSSAIQNAASSTSDAATPTVSALNAKPKRSKIDELKPSKKEIKPAKKSKEKEPPRTPFQYAQKLQEQPNTGGYLKGLHIFYTGGDMNLAGEETRKRMSFIVKHGGTLLPTYDPSAVTHVVVTEGISLKTALRALGLPSLRKIPDHISVVTWKWVISGLNEALKITKRREKGKGKTTQEDDEDAYAGIMDHEFRHAAFAERIPETMPKWGLGNRRFNMVKANLKQEDRDTSKDTAGADFSRISEFTPDRIGEPERPSNGSKKGRRDRGLVTPSPSPERQFEAPQDLVQPTAGSTAERHNTVDPLAGFYAAARAEKDASWPQVSPGEESDPSADSDNEHSEPTPGVHIPKRGWTCDSKTTEPGNCVNQVIIDKLGELLELHKSKPSDDDHWRAYSYTRVIPAIRRFPKRIESYADARSIRGVGDKTALKIMEILQTGDLRRIEHERTEDVEATRIFQGIYGVGQTTAFKWYASGCRTLDDIKTRKGGITLSTVQEIGVRFYDDINHRMPRSEAAQIFNIIKPIALALDSKLFIQIMGSFRRGKADCGDIDIIITRPTEDGKTHAGVLAHLLKALHQTNVITEDLSLPDDWNDLEAIYRGLCRLPNVKGARRRRIDFLTVPWASRGAALLYYTGDDIFNRSMRLKANSMGYSLNQRGLYGGVVRNPSDRRLKTNEGSIIASQTEEEIFKILGVPWQEPHERVRG